MPPLRPEPTAPANTARHASGGALKRGASAVEPVRRPVVTAFDPGMGDRERHGTEHERGGNAEPGEPQHDYTPARSRASMRAASYIARAQRASPSAVWRSQSVGLRASAAASSSESQRSPHPSAPAAYVSAHTRW